MNNHRLICAFFIIGVWTVSWGQHISDPTLNEQFAANVKSVEEFMLRFNGEASYPGLEKNSPDYRKKNLFSLFDVEMDESLKKKANAFVNKVIKDNTRLEFCDTTWYAQVGCNVISKGKNVPLTLTIRPECHNGKRRRWALCGAKGVYGNLITTSEDGIISPLEHDLNFIQLSSTFHHDLKNLPGYMSESHEFDQLTAFVTLAQAGLLKFDYVTSVKFIFMQIPDYVFTIEEVGRKGFNSGWLITVFSELPDEMKPSYKKNILGM
ncbi:MAG: hypothetical protein J5529_04870 [Prevotella sp.]|nr:hypothetical protein [Prevotella sp.]